MMYELKLDLEKILNILGEDAKAEVSRFYETFALVSSSCKDLDVEFVVDLTIARGLGYY